jgi:3-phosphoshikimate 1-carboxyvinyltransferase
MAPTGAWIATPGRGVGGDIAVPGDKSISHRALMLGGIAEGTTVVNGFLEGEDCLATMAAMRSMGVAIERGTGGHVAIEGVGLSGLSPPRGPLDMGNAGTAMRLLTGLLAGQSFDSVLVGDSSLMKRPMERVAAPLRQMGAVVETSDGRPPVRIRGGQRLRGIDHRLNVASAQVKSALLLAGLYASGTTSVTEPAVTRDHTERMLRAFGIEVSVDGGRVSVTPGAPRATQIDVPGDFSSAAFFIVAATIAGASPLLIRNVGINATRTGLVEILRLMGGRIEFRNPRQAGGEPVADLLVEPTRLQGITVPPGLVPLAIDEFPALFVAAALAEGETRVSGAAELRVKESDRIGVMAEGLAALGASVEALPDGMHIRGGRLSGGTVDSHGDHRIAMAFAVAAACAEAPVRILDVANVATSFPGFPAVARQSGLRVSTEAA